MLNQPPLVYQILRNPPLPAMTPIAKPMLVPEDALIYSQPNWPLL